MLPAWAVALIAVGSFAAGAFIAWDHLRPGYLQRGLPELPPEEEEAPDGES
jgi:hypothetical protein